MRVTVSPNKRTGDRSFCEHVFEIVATNSSHTQLRMLTAKFPWEPGQIFTFYNDEYEMSDAEHFVIPGEPQIVLSRG